MHCHQGNAPLQSRRQLLVAVGATALASRAAAQTTDASRQLGTFLDQVFAETLAENPELATSLGLDKGAHADAKSKLRDASLAGVARRKARNSDQLRRLKAIDRRNLSGMAAVNYDTLLFDLQSTEDANQAFVYGDGAGSPYVLAQISGAWQDVPDFLTSQHSVETRADCEAYVSRLEAFARVMDQEVERVRRDVGLGVMPPDYAIAGALAGMKLLRVSPDRSTLVLALADKARAKSIAGDWKAGATAAYTAKVIPALDRQMNLLESLKAKATHDAGCWKLPDGRR